jgi:cobaltochelatase CobS
MSTSLVSDSSARSHTLMKVADVFDVAVPDELQVPVFTERTPDVPAIDPHYVFDKEKLRRVLQWLDGSFEKNMLLTGPTGCGKSSIILQVCARLNIEVFTIGCHGKLEFSEMLGTTQLAPFVQKRNDTVISKLGSFISTLTKGKLDGETLVEWLQRLFSSVVTRYVYGAASLAASRGAVLLCDEINFLHPSTVGAMNTMLDGGPLLIPETGEVIDPQPGFRIAVTGNALDGGDDISLHRGVQRMNVALMNRFLTLRCDYMDKLQEYIHLQKASNLPAALITHMTEIAHDVRNAFKQGVIETTVSTRVLRRWAKLVDSQSLLLTTPEAQKLVISELRFALLDGANAEDAEAVVKLVKAKIADSTTYQLKPVATPAPVSIPKVVHLYVQPNNGAPKYWGAVVEGDGTEQVFSGSFGAQPTVQTKNAGYVATEAVQKLQSGYQVITIPMPVKDAMNAVQQLVITNYKLLQNGSVAQIPDQVVRDAMTQVCSAIGHADWAVTITS